MKKIYFTILLFLLSITLIACNNAGSVNYNQNDVNKTNSTIARNDETKQTLIEEKKNTEELKEIDNSNVNISLVSGTSDCYKIEDTTITFSNITEDTIYSIEGEFDGNIIVDVSDEYKFELELNGFLLVSYNECPIVVNSCDKMTITAKKDTENYIYDYRDTVTNEEEYNASIYSLSDLDIEGKGKLLVKSTNNNGIHTKDDLSVKNLTLVVECEDNGLKGNDSVEIESGTIEIISRSGDGIKTTSSDVSNKGNQKGTVSILSGDIIIHSLNDAIDSSYDVNIKEENGTVNLNIYTDSYSSYSSENKEEETSSNVYYIKTTTKTYNYSIKYLNSEEEYKFVDAEYLEAVTEQGMRNRTTYYYYKFDKLSTYSKMVVYQYDSTMSYSQDSKYRAKTENLTLNNNYDTILIQYQNSSLSSSWTNKNNSNSFNQGGMGGFGGGMGPGGGGMGGMEEGNSDKKEYSSKGIKATNEIIIDGGNIIISSYDDCFHTNLETLENGGSSLGNITINGGVFTLNTKDDGIHADNKVVINDGTINIKSSYEGVEGKQIELNGGCTSIISSDDGMNATTTSGTGITINNGYLYAYAGGDGLDSNSRTSYQGLIINGGNIVVIQTSSMNSCLDTENGYKYTAGKVLCVGPYGGMSNETTNCSNFSSAGTKKQLSLSANQVVRVEVSSSIIAELKMPSGLSSIVVYLGSNSATISSNSNSKNSLDVNGVYFK